MAGLRELRGRGGGGSGVGAWVCCVGTTIKCGHARRFGSPSAGSGPRLYCILARPFAAAGHDTGRYLGRLQVGSMGVALAGGPVGLTRFGLGAGRSRCSLLPSRTLRIVRLALAFVSGYKRPGRA